MDKTFVPYSDAVEVVGPGEEQTFEALAATMRGIAQSLGDRQRRTTRPVHGKSHGLLRAEVRVHDGLPGPLRQGLAAAPARYGAILRFSTTPGDILADSVSTPRGVGVKIVGVPGEKAAGHEGQATQDFLLVNRKAFEARDAAEFLGQLKTTAAHANDSDALKQVVSATAQAAESVLETVGLKSATLRAVGHVPTNPLGETFASLVPVRWGDYFGKVALWPVSPNLTALTDKHLPNARDWDAIRQEFQRFFRAEREAVWELRVQLCTDLKAMPVEDATVEWDEKASPYVAVATVTAAAQEPYSDARRVFVDERLSFNPWHCLAAHRPLGQVMRARRVAYAELPAFRMAREGRERVEPRSLDELPD